MTLWFTSDTHFGHAGMLSFISEHTMKPLRDFFDVECMNQFIIRKWNEVVKPSDHVYHLGDVAMRQSQISEIGKCNGHKRLITGNHDIFTTKKYMQFFDKVMGMRVFPQHKLIFTHIPIHPSSLKVGWTNVHGHIHNNHPPDFLGPNYLNISTEVTDYTPVNLEWVLDQVKSRS